MSIPRYPPDAKVPGTITVLVPLALTLQFVAAMKGVSASDPKQFVAALLEDMRTSEAFARARVAAQRGTLVEQVTASAQIVSTDRASATAAYLQAKLAETIGVGATVSSPETWLHVYKHAAQEGTLVIFLGIVQEGSFAEIIREEAQTRGARFCSVPDIDHDRAVGSMNLLLPLVRTRSRLEHFTEIFFAQHLCLALLQAHRVWAPFQRHRLSTDSVKGLRGRTYVEG